MDDAIEYLDNLIERMTAIKPPSSTGAPLQGTPTVWNSSESSGMRKDARNWTTAAQVFPANKAGIDCKYSLSLSLLGTIFNNSPGIKDIKHAKKIFPLGYGVFFIYSPIDRSMQI